MAHTYMHAHIPLHTVLENLMERKIFDVIGFDVGLLPLILLIKIFICFLAIQTIIMCCPLF